MRLPSRLIFGFTLAATYGALALVLIAALTSSPAEAGTKPSTPDGIKISTTTDGATITWKSTPRAGSYSVCLTTNAQTAVCTRTSKSSSSRTVSFGGLKPTGGRDYFAIVRASNSAGTTSSKKVGFDLKKPQKPAAPTGIKIASSWNGATITWGTAARATSYTVCLRTNATTSTCAYTSKPTSSRSATFTGLKPTGGRDYFAVVRATNTVGTTSSAKKGFDLKVAPKPSPKPTTPASKPTPKPSTPSPKPSTTTTPAATPTPTATAPTPPPTSKPAVPSDIKVTPSWDGATITWSAAARASTYSVCLTTNADTSTCAATSPASAALSTTFTGLKPTGGRDYFAIVRATNSLGAVSSAKIGFDLPVGTTTGVGSSQVTPTSRRITWAATTNADGYDVQIAENAAMTTQVRGLTSTASPLTVSDLTPGRDYFIRVRGRNGTSAPGAWSAIVSTTQKATPADVSVMTWNLCGQDKCVTSSNGMKKWTTRKAIAGAWIRTFDVDVIATQESHAKDTRFETELPGYGIAAYYSAKSLYYDKSELVVERSGTITLDSTRKRYAVWALFRSIDSGARFIVADAHLEPYKGVSYDRLREAQSKKLLAGIATANPEELPVVYAGDYNSNKSNANQSRYPGGYDAPARVFSAAGIPDSLGVAGKAVNATYNSANQAKNPPMKYSDHVDHIYLDPRIDVDEWSMLLRMSGSSYATPFMTDHNAIRVDLTIPAH